MNRKVLLVIILLAIILFVVYFLISQQTFSSYENSKETLVKHCSASLSFSVSGNGTCSIKTSIITNYCDGRTYELKNKDTKCSGTIKNDKEVILCDWQVSFGNYTYNLYIDNEIKESRSITCLEFVPEICTTCEPCI